MNGEVVKNTARDVTTNLAEVLERVLDKGIVIVGDIKINVAETELLEIKIRLLITSVDKARQIGINWWEQDPYLSSSAEKLLETSRNKNQRSRRRKK
jgi:metallophosphoesterase superfamily enzyme